MMFRLARRLSGLKTNSRMVPTHESLRNYIRYERPTLGAWRFHGVY